MIWQGWNWRAPAVALVLAMLAGSGWAAAAAPELPYVEWLEGSWGEVDDDGSPIFGGCDARNAFSRSYGGELMQKSKHVGRKHPGMLAFSSRGATDPTAIHVSSGYPDIVEGSLIQSWFDGQSTTVRLPLELRSEGDFVSFFLGDLIPGIKFGRKIIPLGNDAIKLVVSDPAAPQGSYQARDRFYIRCP